MMCLKPVRFKAALIALVLLPMVATTAQAVVVDFFREFSGRFRFNDRTIGDYTAKFRYNTNVLGNVQKLAAEGDDPRLFPDTTVAYRPFLAFKDKYFIEMRYVLEDDAPDGFQNRNFVDSPVFLIDEFIISNDRTFTAGEKEDRFLIFASRTVGNMVSEIQFEFISPTNPLTDRPQLSSTSLSDILLGNADGMFRGTPNSNVFIGKPLGFPPGTPDKSDVNLNNIGPIFEIVSAPSTLVLLGLGLAVLAATGRTKQ